MCSERQLAVAGKCTCEVSSILDANGNYDIESVKLADIEWYQGLWGGDYEVLHSAIDVEEPEAAQIISIASNKCLQDGMKTTHVEIWHAIQKLCKPDPRDGPLGTREG